MDTYPPPQNKQTATKNIAASSVSADSAAASNQSTDSTATPTGGTAAGVDCSSQSAKPAQTVQGATATGGEATAGDSAAGGVMSSEELYAHLNLVSRSFAITIPFMKQPLRDQVALAYLLCRIVDTVEDDALAPINDKITWLSDFSFLADDEFADEDVLHGLKLRAVELTSLGGSAPDDIKLVVDLERAVHLLQSYDKDVQEVVCHAVAILAHGMATSLRQKREHEEISSLDDVDNYCYSVAGVVGEMLAELFCLSDRAAPKKELLELSVSFGEGLQLTNILRDRAKDAERGASFLPPAKDDEAESVLEYVAITQGHLDDAIKFISLLPARSSFGVRMFCLTNVAMAMVLLRQVAHRPLDPKCNYKLKRSQVKHLFLLCRMAARSNRAVRALSFALSLGMKSQRRSARQLRDKVSLWDHSSTN